MSPRLLVNVARTAAMCALVFMLPVTVTGCDRCRKSAEVFDAYRAAAIEPEAFDQWLTTHPTYFTEGRLGCVAELAAATRRQANAMYDRCDEIFTSGSDEWNACYADVENELENRIAFLNAIGIAARGQTPFAQTPFGSSMIFVKQLDPGTYEESFTDMFTRFEAPLRAGVTCEKCREWWQIF